MPAAPAAAVGELIIVEKGYQGRWPKTWISISERGRSALTAELDALQQIVERRRNRD